jgi:hypothetical protein
MGMLQFRLAVEKRKKKRKEKDEKKRKSGPSVRVSQ